MTFMPHDAAVEGEASPDVVRAPDGTFVDHVPVVRARPRRRPREALLPDHDRLRALLGRRTRSLSAGYTAPADRLIDAALAWTPAGLLLGFKTRHRRAGLRDRAFDVGHARRSVAASSARPTSVCSATRSRTTSSSASTARGSCSRRRTPSTARSSSISRATRARRRVGCAGRPGASSTCRRRRGTPEPASPASTYEHANCAFLVDHTIRQ